MPATPRSDDQLIAQRNAAIEQVRKPQLSTGEKFGVIAPAALAGFGANFVASFVTRNIKRDSLPKQLGVLIAHGIVAGTAGLLTTATLLSKKVRQARYIARSDLAHLNAEIAERTGLPVDEIGMAHIRKEELAALEASKTELDDAGEVRHATPQSSQKRQQLIEALDKPKVSVEDYGFMQMKAGLSGLVAGTVAVLGAIMGMLPAAVRKMHEHKLIPPDTRISFAQALNPVTIRPQARPMLLPLYRTAFLLSSVVGPTVAAIVGFNLMKGEQQKICDDLNGGVTKIDNDLFLKNKTALLSGTSVTEEDNALLNTRLSEKPERSADSYAHAGHAGETEGEEKKHVRHARKGEQAEVQRAV